MTEIGSQDGRAGAPVLRVVVAQVASGLDLAANRDLVTAAVTRAAADRPDLVVLPEATMRDFGPPGTDLAGSAEPLDGPFVRTLAAAARESGAVVVAGMFERRTVDGAAQAPYNTVLAVGPDGSLLARYRKLHLYDAFSYRESERLAAGDEDPPTFEVDGVRVGVMTCYDLRFPEVARLLVDAGADAVLVPAAWVAGERKVEQWQALLTARAIENTVYVVAAAQPGPRYCGHSAVLDPTGVLLAGAGPDGDQFTAELRVGEVEAARSTNPSLANRRFTVTRR